MLFDSSTSGSASNIGATYTLAFNNVAGDIVFVTTRATEDTITGVTYASVALTFVDKILLYGTVYISLYVLSAPAVGANNIVVSNSDPGIPNIIMAAASYSGSKPTGQPDAEAQASGPNEANTDVLLTTGADNCWMVLACGDTNDNTLTAGTNAVERVAPVGHFKFFDTNGPQTPAGAKTMTIAHSNNNLKSVIASFSPAGAGPIGLMGQIWL